MLTTMIRRRRDTIQDRLIEKAYDYDYYDYYDTYGRNTGSSNETLSALETPTSQTLISRTMSSLTNTAAEIFNAGANSTDAHIDETNSTDGANSTVYHQLKKRQHYYWTIFASIYLIIVIVFCAIYCNYSRKKKRVPLNEIERQAEERENSRSSRIQPKVSFPEDANKEGVKKEDAKNIDAKNIDAKNIDAKKEDTKRVNPKDERRVSFNLEPTRKKGPSLKQEHQMEKSS